MRSKHGFKSPKELLTNEPKELLSVRIRPETRKALEKAVKGFKSKNTKLKSIGALVSKVLDDYAEWLEERK